MNIDLLIPLLVTSTVVIIGWFAVHFLLANRDHANKRHDTRVQYLMEAWRRLESASNRSDDSRSGDLEAAIADIQLFGNPRQIELAQKFVGDFADTGRANLDELLNDLRQDLRKELRLETVPKNMKYLRIIPNSNQDRQDRRRENEL